MGADGEDVGVGGPLTVLVVCTGNICRSPMAEIVLRELCSRVVLDDGRRLAELVAVESAGTSSWHADEEMDRRARSSLDAAGYLGEGTQAAQVTDLQLQRADVVVALDRGHRAELRARAPTVEVTVLRWWAEGIDLDVPDPYYGDDDDFDACLELIEPGCRALVIALADRLR